MEILTTLDFQDSGREKMPWTVSCNCDSCSGWRPLWITLRRKLGLDASLNLLSWNWWLLVSNGSDWKLVVNPSEDPPPPREEPAGAFT